MSPQSQTTQIIFRPFEYMQCYYYHPSSKGLQYIQVTFFNCHGVGGSYSLILSMIWFLLHWIIWGVVIGIVIPYTFRYFQSLVSDIL